MWLGKLASEARAHGLRLHLEQLARAAAGILGKRVAVEEVKFALVQGRAAAHAVQQDSQDFVKRNYFAASA